jgi:thioredoxin 1
MLRYAIVVGVAVLGALWLAAPARADDETPPIFDKRPYPDAKKAAADQKKWLIVKATATWCAPCKRMDKTTWRDEKVVSWLKGHAIAVVFDVDKDKQLSEELAIEAMPTMIAFREGKEFDRVVGFKGPEDFLAWLEGIDKGEKSIEGVKKRAAKGAEGGKVDVRARMDLARELQQAGKAEEAAEEYVWLWEHMLEHAPAMYGVRLSFMAGDMERLAKGNAGAKKKFTELRDKTGKALDGEKVDQESVSDWVVLNKIIGDSKATLSWYDRVKDQARWRPLVNRVSRDLMELFIAQKRWADVGRMYPDPIRELEKEDEFRKMIPRREPPAGMDEASRKMIEEMPSRMFREKAARLYAGLLAAKRDGDAEKFAARARELDDSPKMVATLISTALEAEQARKAHLEWIDAAKGDAAVAGLKERVEAGLAGETRK